MSPKRQSDKGLASERTALAMNRSGLAGVVCIAVLLRHLWPLRGSSQLIVLVLVTAAAIAWAVGILTSAGYRGRRGTRLQLGPRGLGLITAATVMLALGAIALTIATSP
jgi:hypothetical protein